MPAARDGGSRGMDLDRCRKALRRVDAEILGALDAPAMALATKLHVKPDIRFGVIPASIEAAERGLDVALVVPEDRVASVVSAIEDANERLAAKIAYETVPLM